MFELRPTDDPVAVDLAHAALLLGAAASLKPDRVLELGLGAGATADAVLQALRWNGRGTLTVVDNWADWGGAEPPHAARLRAAGADVVVADEEAFVRAAPTGRYDLLVSDADHRRSDRWLGEHLRVVRPGGLLFFHDTANPDFPNLRRVADGIAALGLSHCHFTASSRPDERCGRGWLMAVARPPTMAVVTAWDGGAAEVGEFTWANRQDYCRRHGYALRGGRVAGGGVWAKIPALAAALAEGFGWAVWMDADVWVTAPERRLEGFVEGPADLVASHDVNGLNAGVLFVRNTAWARALLAEWAAVRPRFATHPWAEQTALVSLLLREPKDKWSVVPQKAFNAYLYGEYPGLEWPAGQWQPGDFALHLPGLGTARRLEILRRVAAGG